MELYRNPNTHGKAGTGNPAYQLPWMIWGWVFGTVPDWLILAHFTHGGRLGPV